MSLNSESKLIFIAGLGHSGSTLFDLLLGAQPGITGLGEMDVFLNQEKKNTHIKRFDKYPCTCGKEPKDCPVWGGLKSTFKKGDDESYGSLYRVILLKASESTGSNVFVDSSKNIFALRSVLNSLEEIGIKRENFFVIHLTKDVRSYSISTQKNSRKKRRTVGIFRNWVRKNRKLEEFLRKNKIQTIKIGYEELTLSTSLVLKKVMDFTGHDARIVYNIGNSGSHIISGNNMRLDQADKIYYDYRWFINGSVHFWYTFFPNAGKLNRKWVYSNVHSDLVKDSKFDAPK